MGSVLATRLLEHGCDLTVYNRTRAKAEPLAKRGARIVEQPADLGDRDIVITSVAGSRDFAEVMTGTQGLLANGNRVPAMVIDTSSFTGTLAYAPLATVVPAAAPGASSAIGILTYASLMTNAPTGQCIWALKVDHLGPEGEECNTPQCYCSV